VPALKKRVLLLGSTGSIGTSALKVARALPDRMEIVGLAAHSSVDAALAQVAETGVKHLALFNDHAASQARSALPSTGCSNSAIAKKRAASKNCTSFINTNACIGVAVFSRLTLQNSRVGASNTVMFAGGIVLRQNVYKLRR